MPSPTPSTQIVRSRPDLAALLEIDLQAERLGYVAYRVLPVIEVALQAGTFPVIPVEELLRVPATARAAGAPYTRDEYQYSIATYSTKEYGIEEAVDRRLAAMYNSTFDAEAIATLRARDIVLRSAEIRVASAIFNTSTWTGSSLTTAVSTPWSSHDDAVPVDDVDAAKLKVYAGTGLWPNALIISRVAFLHLRSCAQVLDRIASQGAGASVRAGDIAAADLARVFDLDQVIVAGASKNAANEGLTASIAQIWSPTMAMVARIGTSSDPSEPCVGKTFHWSGDGSTIDGTVESYTDIARRSDIVRVRHDVDEKILYPQCGHLLTNITA